MKKPSTRRLITLLINGVVLSVMSLSVAGTARAEPSQPTSPTTQHTAASPTAKAKTPAAKPKPHTTQGSQAPESDPACKPSTERAYSCFALKRTDVIESKAIAPDAAPAGYGPADIQSAYNLPAASSSPTVAIVDAFDDPHAESDLAVYRAQYGLPACTTDNGCFTKVATDGSTNYPEPPPPGDDWVGETSLDLDAVSAACPACRILLVEAETDLDADSLPLAVETARTMGAKFISMSWGGDEDSRVTSQEQIFNHPGIVYAASSGDGGYAAGVIYPSTSQYVLSVGGTSLNRAPGTTRGWTESAWGGAGSGCSLGIAKPAWQDDVTACTTRADTDISADADLNTGLAVYDTYGEHGSGWGVVGGTSLAAPLVTSMYALAGTPIPGSYPAAYPYDDPARATDINDVTSGANGSCTPSELCHAGPGWDGPTGLGTPNGVGALTTGPHGEIKGEVTDSDTGKPVAGVRVATGEGRTATTDADGNYDLVLPPGSYALTAGKYGYADKSVTGVAVTADSTVTENFTLTAMALHTVSGTVADGSGHGWAMRAKITVDGYPDGPVYSDPYTGHYSVSLPAGADYTMHIASADLTGYTDQDTTVKLADSDVTQNVALKVDTSTCTAPGYAYQEDGATEAFTGWSGKTTKDGWTVTDAVGNGQTWDFDNPGSWLQPPGGDQYFANVNSENYGEGGTQDTSLVSPAVDLTGKDNPEIGFDTAYISFPDGSAANVDLSLDGGTTWSTVWNPKGGLIDRVDIPIPQAAGKSDVRVRFHYTGNWSRSWNLDNVLVGTRGCAPQTGALVAGVVTDANTGDPLIGAKVSSDSVASQYGETTATPDDTGLGDGYYWLFSSHTGSTGFSAGDGKYTPAKATVKVPADAVVHKNFKLDAGHVTVATQSVSTTQVLGAAKSKTVQFGNDGTVPVHVSLSEEEAGFGSMGSTPGATIPSGAPVTVTKTRTSLAAPTHTTTTPKDGPVLRPATAAASGPWTGVADYPEPVEDAVVAAHGGKVYVAGGFDGNYSLQDANVYDPATQAWSSLARMPERLEASSAGFIGDTLYVAGGFDDYSRATTHAYAYHPGTDTWTRMADMPSGAAAAGSAVADGKLYVIGGCTNGLSCSPAATVLSYDPGSNSWAKAPDYPTPLAFVACGGVNAAVVCAGGTGNSALTSTYSYTPGASGWTRKADLPIDAWGAASAAANGKLEVMGGAVDNGSAVTNQGFAYDPDTDSWSPLPNSNNAGYRGGAACGIFKVGGAGPAGVSPVVEQLPGYDQCGGDVGWMSEDSTGFDVAPGQTVTVQITADSATVSQPGTYKGELLVGTDSPYGSAQPVAVTMNVTPPKTWGKITGTVSDSSGAPVPGATVAICTMYAAGTGMCGPTTYTLKTDGHGVYQLWLNKGFNPLEVIAAKDGYTPQMKIARIQKGATSTVNFALAKNGAYSAAKTQDYLTDHMHSSATR